MRQMFIELPENQFQLLNKKLEELQVKYNVSDCTLSNENIKKLHVEFIELDENKKRAVRDFLIDIIEKSDEMQEEQHWGSPTQVKRNIVKEPMCAQITTEQKEKEEFEYA